MINMKALNPLLSVRKLSPQDLILRVYARAIDTFRKDGEERFKMVFTRPQDIEQFLKSKCSYY